MTKIKATQHTYRGITFTKKKIKDKWGNTVYNPSLKQLHNIIDMVAAIRYSPPPAFDMASYIDVNSDELAELGFVDRSEYDDYYPKDAFAFGSKVREVEEINICSTSCCAAGTAAWHGVGKITKNMGWNEYTEKTFGLGYLEDYCFGGYWSSFDNTPEGAAARILMLVVEGGEKVHNICEKEEYKNIVPMYQKYKDVIVGAKEA